MKKIFFCLILMVLFIPIVNAEEKTIFSVKTVKGSPGQEVEIQVSINNNPSFELLSFEIPLDVNQAEFESCEIEGFDKAMMKNCALNPNNEIIFYALTMNTEEKKLLKDTGVIANIRLKISEKAKNDIPLSIKITSYGKNDTDALDYEIENGYIRIDGGIETKVINEKENLSNEVKKKDVTWNSSDGEVATIDEEGNVEFTNSGNTTITAIDKTGKILYEKTYLVNHQKKKEDNYVVPISLMICIIPICYFGQKAQKGKKKNEKKKNTK